MDDEGIDQANAATARAEEAIVEPLIALADDATADKSTRDRAAALIEEQIKLAQLQRQHLHTQHFRDRFLLAFDLALAIGGVVVVAIIVALFWDAWASRSVVIDAFDVPASLAGRGYSGKVVATELLQDLKQLQAATRTNQAKRAVADAWSNKIELQIPEAGISISDIQALLHRWLSRDEHISGSVVEEGGKIVLSVHGDAILAKEFSGPPSELDRLTTKAAEYVYGASEPYLLSVYLSSVKRDAEAIELAKNSYQAASAADKPLLLNVWGNALSDFGRYSEALKKFQEAVRLKPDFWLGYNGIMAMQLSLGEEEAAIQTGLAMERQSRRGSWTAANVPAAYWENFDYAVKDWPAFRADLAADMAGTGGQGTASTEEAPVDAWALAEMHDWRAAELELETTPGGNTDSNVIAQSALVRGAIDLDKGEFGHAVSEFRTVESIASKDAAVASNIVPPWSCYLALAAAQARTQSDTQAELAKGGRAVDCYRFKGDIADLKGDRGAATAAYAQAASLAPSVPSSYDSWGRMLFRHHAFAAAIEKFRLAHSKGPHWADPLEHWGEALAATGALDQAASKYEEASQLAPRWGLLFLNWGRALDRLGRHSDALVQFRRAWSLDLTAQQRASIFGCCKLTP